MKKLYLFILCAFALSFGQNCLCSCFTTEKKIYKPHSSSVPLVYKEHYSLSMKSEPLVFVDKPVVKKVTTPTPTPTYIQETSEEVYNEYDACVEQCKVDNVSSSLVDFCIREKCEVLKNDQ